MFRCPSCGKIFEEEQSDAMPFCSRRCRLADLNGWFCEERSVPVDIEHELERRAEEANLPDESGESDAKMPSAWLPNRE